MSNYNPPKRIYETDLTILDNYNEDNIIELNVKVEYRYHPGTPASGFSGPPENYDPGSGDEVIVDDASIKIYDAGISNGQPLELPQWLRMVIATQLERHEERMAEEASEE